MSVIDAQYVNRMGAAAGRITQVTFTRPDDEPTERVDVVRKGRKIVLPEQMTTADAIEALRRKEKEEETGVAIHHVIPCFPLDGAIAFQRALDQLYGWTEMLKTPGGFFSPDRPPVLISVPIGPKETTQVAWGRIGVPKIEGYLTTSMNADPPAFVIGGETPRGN